MSFLSTFADAAPASCCCGGAAAAAPAPMPAPIDGAFSLVDHFGTPVDQRSYGDRHLLVFFGFSHCAVVCPRELAKLGAALRALGPLAARVQPLYVSVDPARDTPEVLRACVARHPGGFVGLTGSEAQVEAAKKSFRVFARRVPDAAAPGGYVVPHTALAYFMTPGGRYLAHFAESLDAPAVAARMTELMQGDTP